MLKWIKAIPRPILHIATFFAFIGLVFIVIYCVQAMESSHPRPDAGKVELQTVQTSIHALMHEYEIGTLPNPVGSSGQAATNDLTSFPAPDSGYVLYGSSKGAVADPQNFIPFAKTKYYYTCEPNGTVRQWSNADMTEEFT